MAAWWGEHNCACDGLVLTALTVAQGQRAGGTTQHHVQRYWLLHQVSDQVNTTEMQHLVVHAGLYFLVFCAITLETSVQERQGHVGEGPEEAWNTSPVRTSCESWDC